MNRNSNLGLNCKPEFFCVLSHFIGAPILGLFATDGQPDPSGDSSTCCQTCYRYLATFEAIFENHFSF